MTKTQEALKKIVILIYQITESIESGEIEMGWAKKATDDIDKIIDDISGEYRDDVALFDANCKNIN